MNTLDDLQNWINAEFHNRSAKPEQVGEYLAEHVDCRVTWPEVEAKAKELDLKLSGKELRAALAEAMRARVAAKAAEAQ